MTSLTDKHRVQQALRAVMERALNNQRLDTSSWAAACVRVAMRRHDVEHNVMPPDYELFDPARLLQQFQEHPAAKEYGYEGEAT